MVSKRIHTLALVILSSILAVSVLLNAMFYFAIYNLTEEVEKLEEDKTKLLSLIEHLNTTLSQKIQNVTWAYKGAKSINSVAVYMDATGGTHGLLLKIYAKVEKGSGKVYIATTPKIGIDLQASAEVAFYVASKIAGINRTQYDLFLTVEAPREVYIVDGPSAGSTIAILVLSVLLDVEANKSILVTGTIKPDGRIGPVGGVLAKAIAAAESGADVFAVPEGQSYVKVWVKVREEVLGVPFDVYRLEYVNLEEYLRELGYNLRVVEVRDIFDLIRLYGIQA